MRRGLSQFFIVSLFLASPALAYPYLYEGFPYTVGQNLVNQVNTGVYLGPQDWDQAGAAATNTPIIAGSLTSPIAYQPPSTGEKVSVGPFTTRADRLNFPVVSSGTIFYSLLLNIADLTGQNPVGPTASATGAFLFAFNNGIADSGTTSVPTVVPARLQIRRDPSEAGIVGAGATKFNMTILNTTAPVAGDFNDPTAYLINQTYFVIASYTFNPGAGDDVAKLWINPDPDTFDPDVTTPNDTYTGGDVAAPGIQAIIVRNTGGLPTTSYLDEIRVGTAYRDVIIPEPAGLTLTGVLALAALARRRRG